MGAARKLLPAWRFVIAVTAIVVVAAAGLAQTYPPVSVVTPGTGVSTGSLVAGHVPTATNTGSGDSYTITDIGPVLPHHYLGNNTASSVESDFEQPNDADIDPLVTAHAGTAWTMSTGNFVYELTTAPSAPTTWIWPPASAYPAGKRVFFFDKLGLLSRQNPIVFQPTGAPSGDTFNGVSGNISAGVPGSYVIGESDGSGNWSFNVVQPPPTTVQMTEFGAFPISIAGESDCTWTSGSTTVTCPSHTWSAAEVAQIQAQFNATGHSNWNVVLQYADASNAELITTIATTPTVNTQTFDVVTAPSFTSGNTAASQMRVVNSVSVAVSGLSYSGSNFGSVWELNYGGSGFQYSPGLFTTKVLTPGSATIQSTGTGMTNGTYYCTLAPASGGALGGINTQFAITVSGGHFSGASVYTTNQTGYYTSLAGYTYDSSNGGAFDNVPCTVSIPGWGTGNILLDVYMGLYTVQDTFGRDATSGVYTGHIDTGPGAWCASGAHATATRVGGAVDVGSHAEFVCSSQLPLVWVGYDNQSAMYSIFSYLNGLIPSQRPCIKINGIFLTTGTQFTSPSTSSNSIIGKTCWKGENPYLTGFFVMPGTKGDVFPVVDSNDNNAKNPNGTQVTGPNPDQGGSTFRDLTCWGDQTSSVKPQGCIRFYGLTQRAIVDRVTVAELPGCLVCVGSDSSSPNPKGVIDESNFFELRSAYSGDDSTLTPVLALDSVGSSTHGANNDSVVRMRTFDDFYESLAIRPCGGGVGDNGADRNAFFGIKIEKSGMDSYINPTNEVGLNDQNCTAYSFPSTTGTAVAGGALNGLGDTKFYGLQMSNTVVGTYGLDLQGSLTNANNCCIQVLGNLANAQTLGAGIRIDACGQGCQFNLTSNNATDYALTANSSLISSGAVEYELAYGAQLPSWNIGVNVGCGSGMGIIGTTSGKCQIPASGLSGNLGCLQMPALLGDTTSPAGSCTTTTSLLNGTTPGGSCASHNWVSSLSTSAVPTCTQPDVSDLQHNPGFHPGYVSGRYYTSPMTALATTPLSANTLYAEPFYVGVATTFSKISIDVITAGTSSCELGVYNNSSGVPGTLLVDAGSVSDSISGSREISGQSIVLFPGWYWFAVGCNDGPTLSATSPTNGLFGFLEGLTAQNSNTYRVSISWTCCSGLPATFGTPTYTVAVPSPSVYLRL